MLLLFAAALDVSEPFAAVDAGGWVSGCGSGVGSAVDACCCAVEEGTAGVLLDANFQPNTDGTYRQEGMLSRACKGRLLPQAVRILAQTLSSEANVTAGKAGLMHDNVCHVARQLLSCCF